MEARKVLAKRGKRNPDSVVPLITQELQAPREATNRAQQQRIWLMGVLQDMGPAAAAAVPLLTEILNDPKERNDYVKFQAGQSLQWIGTPSALAANRAEAEKVAEQSARQASPEETRRAAEEGAFRLRQALRDRRPSDGLIEAYLINLRAQGRNAAPAIPTLLRAYKDARLSAAVHALTIETLAAAGVADIEQAAAALPEEDDPLGALIDDTRHPNDMINSPAMSDLAKLGLGPRAIDALIEALRDGRSPGAAAAALGAFGDKSARALPALLPYLDHAQAGGNALQAVGRIGLADPAIVATLRRLTLVPEGRSRAMAAKTLAKLGVAEAIPDIVTALTDSRKYTRILAANALGRFGPEAATAVMPLTNLLADPDQDVRRAAVEALGRIGPAAEPAVPQIAAQLETGDSRLKQSAQQALWQIGGELAGANLEAEAQRHAAADRAEFQRLREGSDAEELNRLLRDLPEARRLQLAAHMGKDAEPEIAYLAAWHFIEAGRRDDAVPILAEILATSDRGEEILTGLGWALMHSDQDADAEAFLTAIFERLKANAWAYSPEQQERINRLLGEIEQNIK